MSSVDKPMEFENLWFMLRKYRDLAVDRFVVDRLLIDHCKSYDLIFNDLIQEIEVTEAKAIEVNEQLCQKCYKKSQFINSDTYL